MALRSGLSSCILERLWFSKIDLFFNLNSRSFTSKSLETADSRLQQTLIVCCRWKQRILHFFLILGLFFFLEQYGLMGLSLIACSWLKHFWYILCSWFRASWITVNNCPTKCNDIQFIIFL
jgi:hypothetical protein